MNDNTIINEMILQRSVSKPAELMLELSMRTQCVPGSFFPRPHKNLGTRLLLQ